MRIKQLLLLVVFIPLSLFAQKKKPWNKPLYDSYKFHYGFAFAFGVMDFSVNHSDYFHNQEVDSIISIEGKSRPYFGVNIVGNVRLNQNWDFRFLPGMSFGQRNLDYIALDSILAPDRYSYNKHTMKIESVLLQFPLLIKYRAVRESNYRPYVIFGATYSLDLAAKRKIKPEEMPKIRLNSNDIYAEIGVGIDNYLPYFKFSTELRFSYGLLNIVNYDNTPYTKVFDRLGSKMVSLIIYFE